MRYSHDKDVNRFVSKLVQEGWHFSRGRHGKLRRPDGSGFVTIPNTPSDHRCLLNLMRDTRRMVSMR